MGLDINNSKEPIKITDLPIDIMLFIFKMLDRDSLLSAGMTCKKWMELSSHEVILFLLIIILYLF